MLSFKFLKQKHQIQMCTLNTDFNLHGRSLKASFDLCLTYITTNVYFKTFRTDGWSGGQTNERTDMITIYATDCSYK